MGKLNNLFFIKKMIGKTVFVIFNYSKFEGYPCRIENVKNENSISVFCFEKNVSATTSIFNIRSIPYEW